MVFIPRLDVYCTGLALHSHKCRLGFIDYLNDLSDLSVRYDRSSYERVVQRIAIVVF